MSPSISKLPKPQNAPKKEYTIGAVTFSPGPSAVDSKPTRRSGEQIIKSFEEAAKNGAFRAFN